MSTNAATDVSDGAAGELEQAPNGPAPVMTPADVVGAGERTSSSSSDYYSEDCAPTPDEYYTLRKEAGLTPPPRDRLDIALKNTIYGVTIRTNDEAKIAVAMGRIIGDGGVFVFVTDMATLPSHQRKGLGARVLQRLLQRVDAEMPHAFCALLADPPGEKLYLRHGFTPNDHETPMYRRKV